MEVRDISLEVMDISEEVMATRIYESTPMWLPSNSISSPLMLALLCLLLCAGHHFKQDVEDYIGVDWYIFKVDSFGFGLKCLLAETVMSKKGCKIICKNL